MNAGPFTARRRSEILSICERRPIDVAIVGGGITGAGVLRDLSLRGLRAALFEKDDFGAGTSGRSSKLIHGGIRYLESGNLRLVFEGLRERHRMLTLAPSLVRPISFLFPVYKGIGRSLPLVASGVFLYHLLALFRNVDRPRLLLRKRLLTVEPMLRKEGLTGGVVYFDAVTDDAALTVATVRSAWEFGGLAVNHAEVTALLREGERVVGVRLLDRLTGKEHEVRARWVVNTSGAWSDSFRARSGFAPPLLRPTKGTHLVVDRSRLRIQNAVVMISPIDRRVTFCIPWEGFILIGTTDTDFTGDPDRVDAGEMDVRYLLECVNHYFPHGKLTPSHVISTFSGLRPLLNGGLSPADATPSSLSREHRIFFEQEGFLTLAGGKLTSFRKMAEETVDWLMSREESWRPRRRQRPTRFMPYPAQKTSAEGDPLVPGTTLRWSNVTDAVDHSMAATIEDVLRRRTPVHLLDRRHGADLVHRVAGLLSERLGLAPEEISRQIAEYNEAIHLAEKGLGRGPA